MRKCGAILVVAALMAAAFFLPEVLSSWNDQQLLDTVSVLPQDSQREGFAESVQLTVAEKVLLLRSGRLTSMDLSREMVEGNSANSASGSVSISVFSYDEESEAVLAVGENEEDSAAYTEEISRLWDARLAEVRQEIFNLQALGGLPVLWNDGDELAYTGYGDRLYVDPDTRMNFQVYHITLASILYSLELTVDVQSGRILSFILQWGRDGAPNWGMRNADSFGSVWRNYWKMDSVGSGWYNGNTKNILEQIAVTPWKDGDYDTIGQISFTYDGQSISVPLEGRGFNGRNFVMTWNC